MALTETQSLAKYGTVAYTAWDEAGAQADWNAKHPGGASPVPSAITPAKTTAITQTPVPAQRVSSQGGSNALEQALIQRGGYNPIDAKNAAVGPRAAELAREFGVSTGVGAGFGFGQTQPTIDLAAIYKASYESPEIQKLNADITAKQKARDEAVAIVNDNPFYSEATRVGKVAKINEKYNDDATTLQNERAMKLADAEIKVNLAMKQYDINNQAYKDQLDLFNNLLSAGGLTNASGEEIASYALATGIPTSMIEGILAKQRQEAIKPQVFENTDDNGNVTLSIVDTNTGNIINTTSLGNVGKGTGGGGGVGSKNLQALKNDVASWMNLTQLAQKYVGVFTKEEILQVYNTFHSSDTWGPAKESPEQLSKIFGTQLDQNELNIKQIKQDVKDGVYTREEALQAYPEYAGYF